MSARIGCELTEQEEARRGEMLALGLFLRRSSTHPDRWQTTWGNKTALGIYRTIRRMVEDGQ